MFKKSPNRVLKAKGFKVKHVVQTCLLIFFGILMLYQLKLILFRVNNRNTNLITSNVSEDPKYMPYKQSKLTRKSLFRVETEVFRVRNDDKTMQKERSDDINQDEKKEEGEEERTNIMDYHIGDINRSSELPLMNGRDEFESFEYPESGTDQHNKDDNFVMEILEETNPNKDVDQEDVDHT